MHLKIVTILTAFALLAILQAGPVSSQSAELKPPYPQVNRAFQSKYCKIEYTADKEQDARQLGADADDSIDRMASDLTPLDPHLLDDFDCTIVQFAATVPGVASPAQEQTQSDGGGRSFRIFLLALSSIPPTSRTLVREPKDEDFSHKTIADEISAVLLERVTRAKAMGWHFSRAPDWFVQGIEGYYGVMHSTAHEQNVTLPLYVGSVCSNPKEVGFTGGIHVGNPYLGGFVVTVFLYDVYGKDRVNRLLMSQKASFEEAFLESIADLSQVQSKYDAWIAKQCSTAPASALTR